MSTCEPCDALLGQLSDTEPHQALARIGRNKLRAMGMAAGYIEFYECTACGCKLGRDMDDKDPGAGWYRLK